MSPCPVWLEMGNFSYYGDFEGLIRKKIFWVITV